MPESLTQAIVRHIKERDFHPSTLVRGMQRVFWNLWLSNEHSGILESPKFHHNYKKVPGLTVADYELRVGLITKRWLFGFADYVDTDLRVYEFPDNSRLQIHVDPNKDQCKESLDFIDQVPQAIAEFTGPTILYQVHETLPNNGFYSPDPTAFVPFLPTTSRRGAFGITTEGTTVLMDDQTKWGVIRNNFAGFSYLVGTSFYFTSSETLVNMAEALRELPYRPRIEDRGQLSCLVQYTNQKGGQRLLFVLSQKEASLQTIKVLLDDYLKRRQGRDYIAVEMELQRSNLVVKAPEGKFPYKSGRSDKRQDHYLIVRNPS